MGESYVLCSLGVLHSDQGRVQEARKCYEQILRIHRDSGDRRALGMALGNLGVMYHRTGRLDKAMEFYTAALDIRRALGNRRHEGTALGNLGDLCITAGKLEDADRYLTQAKQITHDVGYLAAEGAFSGSLGQIAARRGEHEKAAQMIAAGEALLRQANHRFELGKLLCKRGEAQYLSGDEPGAQRSLTEAVDIAQSMGSETSSDLATAIQELSALMTD